MRRVSGPGEVDLRLIGSTGEAKVGTQDVMVFGGTGLALRLGEIYVTITVCMHAWSLSSRADSASERLHCASACCTGPSLPGLP